MGVRTFQRGPSGPSDLNTISQTPLPPIPAEREPNPSAGAHGHDPGPLRLLSTELSDQPITTCCAARFTMAAISTKVILRRLCRPGARRSPLAARREPPRGEGARRLREGNSAERSGCHLSTVRGGPLSLLAGRVFGRPFISK